MQLKPKLKECSSITSVFLGGGSDTSETGIGSVTKISGVSKHLPFMFKNIKMAFMVRFYSSIASGN